MRAALAGSNSVGTSLNIVVAQSVLYEVGFFGLLYSAYTLVLDRFVLRLRPPHTGLTGPAGDRCYLSLVPSLLGS